MIEQLRLFFTVNEIIVHFVHGQVFFTLGLMMGVQWLVQRSRLELVRALPWLAAFGVLEAVATWGNVFIPVQERLLPADLIQNLRFVQLLVYLLNFATLFGFGLRLSEASIPSWAPVYVPLVIVLFGATALATARALTSSSDVSANASIEVLLRYGLCLPAALLVAYGLRLQAARLVGPLKSERLINVLRVAGIGFVFYALFEGVVVPPAQFPPASWLNTDALFAISGIPAGVFRSAVGAVIAWFLFRSLEAFRIEADRQSELLRRQESLIAERERISRDLHDGTIQSIYAAGLVLDDARHALAQAQAAGLDAPTLSRAQAQVEVVLQMLSKTNAEIRTYIYDLRTATIDNKDLARGVLDLIAEFRLRTHIPIEWRSEHCAEVELAPEQRQHVYQIVREALSNVVRHSGASCATVKLVCSSGKDARSEYLHLEISDNGKGIGAAIAESGRGLSNMRERAALLGGTLEITSAPNQGTRVVLRVPIKRLVNA